VVLLLLLPPLMLLWLGFAFMQSCTVSGEAACVSVN
jgi:hypothetical protein